MKIEAGKTYKTRNGRKVRVICTDMRFDGYPVVGLVDYGSDREGAETFTAEGRFNHAIVDAPLDLVAEWREPAEVWLVVGGNGCWLGYYRSEEFAREFAAYQSGSRVVKMVEAAE